MTTTRRGLLLVAGAIAAPHVALAQAFPTRPIRIIVPFPAGGAVDIVARLMAAPLGERLGQPIVVENRPGAGATIGTAAVATAAPDGHTILLTSAAIASAPAMITQPGYDAARDLAPLSLLGDVPLVLTAAPALGVDNMAALLAMARARPGVITYASPGSGTPIHLAMELLKREAGIDLLHVPYRGSPVTDVIAGRVDLHLDSAHAAVARGRAGQVRLLGISTPARLAALPDLPAIAETVPGYNATTWYAFFAPSRVPAPILATLAEALAIVSANPALRERRTAQGVEVEAGNPARLAALLQSDTERWGAIARAAGARLD